jgi:DNA-binding response OmpR family regulator
VNPEHIQDPEPPCTAQEITKKLVLCVDDDAPGLAIRQRLLESVGYAVICGLGAKAGLALFSVFPIHIVILDYSMPELNGAQVAAAMRQMKPEVPIIMLSAHPECPDDVDEAVDNYFVKGKNPRVLLQEVQDLLARGAASSRKKECSSEREYGGRSGEPGDELRKKIS